MIDFLIGIILFFIAIGIIGAIISSPTGRKGLMIVVGLIALIIFVVIGNNNDHKTPSTPAPDPNVVAAQKKAQIEAEQESLKKIPIDKIDMRDFEIQGGSGQNVLKSNSAIAAYSHLSAYATIKNNSIEYTLKSVGIKVDFFDCLKPPQNEGDSLADCDKIQEVKTALISDIPPQQARAARSAFFYAQDFPSLRGYLIIKPQILWTSTRNTDTDAIDNFLSQP